MTEVTHILIVISKTTMPLKASVREEAALHRILRPQPETTGFAERKPILSSLPMTAAV